MIKRNLRHYRRCYKLPMCRSRFKNMIIVVFCICFFMFLEVKIFQFSDHCEFIARVDETFNMTEKYFVYTPGCHMQSFPVVDENIMTFMSRPRDLICEKKPLTRTSDIGATIIMNMDEKEMLRHYNLSDLNSIHCYYREIKRKDDFKNIYSQYISFKLQINSSVNVLPGIEFIQVKCRDSRNWTFYEDFHFFVLNKQNVSNHLTPKSQTRYGVSNENDSTKSKHKGHWGHLNPNMMKTTATIPDESEDRISVMLLGIDSLSHLNFLRQMQQTAAFIHNNLAHVEFWGHNKVGECTFPNLMPVLTGLNESEYIISCLEPVKRANIDKCNFIWKRYKEVGYQTVYAEDVSTVSLFQHFQPGFKIQPTDYYLHTIVMDMERYIGDFYLNNMMLCMGGRRAADVVLEFIRKLIPYLKIQDFFSSFWTVTLTHEYFNWPILLDKDLRHIFELFDEAGIFNKTVIFFMSDHGLRFDSFRQTYQGMVEDHQPLLIALYPRWFRVKYPAAIHNMKMNANRLTTHFDLHETLLDLLDLRNLEESKLRLRSSNITETDTLPRGISFFLPIPITRTCDNAGLSPDLCLCHRREELPTNDPRVRRAVHFLLKLINERIEAYPQCRVLYLNSILEGMVAAPHQKIVEDVINDYSSDITVRIQVWPGLGVFESTVRFSVNSTELAGGISRINLYSNQSYCVDQKQLKMFCYCYQA